MSILQKITKQIYPYMNEQGYTFSKKCFYKIHNDIAYCLEFDMPGGLVYATFFCDAIVHSMPKPLLHLRK